MNNINKTGKIVADAYGIKPNINFKMKGGSTLYRFDENYEIEAENINGLWFICDMPLTNFEPNIMPALSKDEITILEHIDHYYKFVARDLDGSIYIFKTKPDKARTLWTSTNDGDRIKDISFITNAFKFISFADEQPYNIQELLDGQEMYNE